MKPNTETKMSEAQEPVAWSWKARQKDGSVLQRIEFWNPISEHVETDKYRIFDIRELFAAPQDQTTTIAAQQEVIKQMRLFIMDNCLNTSGKEVNGNRLSEHARKALTIQPSLDTLKKHDEEVQSDLIKEIKRLDSIIDQFKPRYGEIGSRDIDIAEKIKAIDGKHSRPPHIAKLIGGE